MKFWDRVSPQKGEWDKPFLFALFLLIFSGLSVLYSSSSWSAMKEFEDSFYYLKKQLLWVGIGLLCMWITMNLPLEKFSKYGIVFISINLFLLVLVFVPGVGKSVSTYYGRNFNRWIGFGGIQFQPSELIKLTLLFYLSGFITRVGSWKAENKSEWILPSVISLVSLILIILEPAFGTTMEISIILFLYLYISGFQFRKIFIFLLCLVPLIYILIDKVGYRKKRIEVWLDPYKFRFEEGHQLVSSYKAFADGGIFGEPLSSGYAHKHLPYAHTDFILAAFVEDYGFLGFVFLFLIFSFLLFRIYRFLLKIETPFYFYLGVGIFSLLSLQFLLNSFVETGLLPITGLSFPFLSYGGSSMLVMMISAGIYLNIVKHDGMRGKP